MGARVYNQTTSLFSSVDPVYGGNTTAYIYPQDPINHTDLDGKWRRWARKAWNWSGRASRWLTNSRAGRAINYACSFTWGVVSMACGGVYAAAYARQGRYRQAATSLASGAVGGAAAKIAYRTLRKGYNAARHSKRYHTSNQRYRLPRYYSYRNRSTRRAFRYFSASVGSASNYSYSHRYRRW